MNATDVSKVLFFASVKCPLCSETFRCRYNLRIHLSKHHTGIEAEEFYTKLL